VAKTCLNVKKWSSQRVFFVRGGGADCEEGGGGYLARGWFLARLMNSQIWKWNGFAKKKDYHPFHVSLLLIIKIDPQIAIMR